MATTNKRILLHDLLGNNLYPVTSASLVNGLDSKIKGLVANGFSIEIGTVALGTNTAITGITLTTNANNGTAKLNFTTGTIHSGGAEVNGFVKITTDANGHVTLGTAVTIDDILGLSDADNKEKRIATEDYVDGKLSEGISAAKALHFCGVAANANDLKENTTLGAVYVASGDFTFKGNEVESGDMIICTVAKDETNVEAQYTVIQANIDGAVVAGTNLSTNTLIAGNGNKSVSSTTISVGDVVTASDNIANGNLAIGTGTKGLSDSGVRVADVKTVLNTSVTQVAAGKVWTSTASGGEWADHPKHISVMSGTGIDVTGESLEKTISLSTVEARSTTGTAVTLSTGTGSVDAVTDVTVDGYGRVTGVEKTSFSVTLPAVPVQGASDGLKLDGTTVKHDVTLNSSTAAVTLEYGTTFTADTVTRDAYGHVTNVKTTTFTLPAAPEEVEAQGDGVVLATNESGTIKVTHSTKLGTSITVGSNASGSANYGAAISIPNISVDEYGHVTAASDVSINIPAAQNTFDKIDGNVVGDNQTIASTGLSLGTLQANVGSTIHLGTGLALMPNTDATASIVAALTYTEVTEGGAASDDIDF